MIFELGHGKTLSGQLALMRDDIRLAKSPPLNHVLIPKAAKMKRIPT